MHVDNSDELFFHHPSHMTSHIRTNWISPFPYTQCSFIKNKKKWLWFIKKSIRIQRIARPIMLEFPLSFVKPHVRPDSFTVPERALFREGSRPLWNDLDLVPYRDSNPWPPARAGVLPITPHEFYAYCLLVTRPARLSPPYRQRHSTTTVQCGFEVGREGFEPSGHIKATGRFKTGAINHSATLPLNKLPLTREISWRNGYFVLKMLKNWRIFDSSPPLHWLGLPICPVKDLLTTSGLSYWSCVPSVGLEPTRISPLIPEISLYYLFQHKGIFCPPGETRTLTFSRTSRPKRDACCQFRHRRSCFH